MNPNYKTSKGTVASVAVETTVFVQSVTDGKALVQDRLGRVYPLTPVTNMMGSGTFPRAGESWTFQRLNGIWTFVRRVIPNPPVITGDRSGDLSNVVGQLISALDSSGVVVDSTVGGDGGRGPFKWVRTHLTYDMDGLVVPQPLRGDVGPTNAPPTVSGVTVYTPTLGEVLFDAWIELPTYWDGGKGFSGPGAIALDLHPGSATARGILSGVGGSNLSYGDWSPGNGTAPYVISQASLSDVIDQLKYLTTQPVGNSLVVSPFEAGGSISSFGAQLLPFRWTDTSPLIAVVSQDGSTGRLSPATCRATNPIQGLPLVINGSNNTFSTRLGNVVVPSNSYSTLQNFIDVFNLSATSANVPIRLAPSGGSQVVARLTDWGAGNNGSYVSTTPLSDLLGFANTDFFQGGVGGGVAPTQGEAWVNLLILSGAQEFKAIPGTPVVPPSPPDPPANLTLPTLSGATGQYGPVVGDVLVANPGTWSNSPTSYNYAWTASTPIDGGQTLGYVLSTSSTYQVAAEAIGFNLYCIVTATNDGGTSAAEEAVTSPVMTQITGATGSQGVPRENDVLRAVAPTFNTSAGLSYQWNWVDPTTGGVTPIAGATLQTHLVQPMDVGSRLQCVIRFSPADTPSLTPLYSTATSIVVARPLGVFRTVDLSYQGSSAQVTSAAVSVDNASVIAVGTNVQPLGFLLVASGPPNLSLGFGDAPNGSHGYAIPQPTKVACHPNFKPSLNVNNGYFNGSAGNGDIYVNGGPPGTQWLVKVTISGSSTGGNASVQTVVPSSDLNAYCYDIAITRDGRYVCFLLDGPSGSLGSASGQNLGIYDTTTNATTYVATAQHGFLSRDESDSTVIWTTAYAANCVASINLSDGSVKEEWNLGGYSTANEGVDASSGRPFLFGAGSGLIYIPAQTANNTTEPYYYSDNASFYGPRELCHGYGDLSDYWLTRAGQQGLQAFRAPQATTDYSPPNPPPIFVEAPLFYQNDITDFQPSSSEISSGCFFVATTSNAVLFLKVI